ncbi:L,D-transpeptidase family protein [Slackia sp.]|uniref:L,D-transpeptidase family protein n=1 Tax=Slackia sp. TaxID=2049041 RepID=UPI002E76F2D4|nr:L,D-transpeptidase family protein [Slackia sp.]MEE0518518.1 L,D-transpeptidase family protein [Slackia sp.]
MPSPTRGGGRHAAGNVPESTVAMPRVDRGSFSSFNPASPSSSSQGAFKGAGAAAPSMPGKSSKKKVIFIVLGAVAALLAAVYIIGAVVFMGRFYPNTTMGSVDLSLKTAEEAASLLSSVEENYVLRVQGQGLDFSVSSEDAGVGVDARAIVDSALSDTNPWLWPVSILLGHDAGSHLMATSDAEALDAYVRTQVDAFNESAIPSEDACVSFDSDSDKYVVKQEVYGDQVSADAVIEQVSQAMASMAETLDLGEDVLIVPAVLSDDARLSAAAEKANAMIGCDVILKDSTNGTVMSEVTGSDVSAWIYFDENLEPALDESAMNAWVQEVAASFNTVGTTRTYTRPDGKTVTAEGGDYGWAVDADSLTASLKDAVLNATVGEITVPCSSTGNGYTKAGQDWGAYCDIDLAEQHAYYYDASGNLLWDAPIVSGKPNGEDDTPTGVYYLKNLQQNVSLRGPIDPETNKPEWDSPVDYWMPFVGNMVGLHDAPWQPSSVFGDAEAYKTYGSHGCVNLSSDSAASLFGIIQIGDAVIVHW